MRERSDRLISWNGPRMSLQIPTDSWQRAYWSEFPGEGPAADLASWEPAR